MIPPPAPVVKGGEYGTERGLPLVLRVPPIRFVVQVTESTWEHIKDHYTAEVHDVQVKGKGLMTAYRIFPPNHRPRPNPQDRPPPLPLPLGPVIAADRQNGLPAAGAEWPPEHSGVPLSPAEAIARSIDAPFGHLLRKVDSVLSRCSVPDSVSTVDSPPGPDRPAPASPRRTPPGGGSVRGRTVAPGLAIKAAREPLPMEPPPAPAERREEGVRVASDPALRRRAEAPAPAPAERREEGVRVASDPAVGRQAEAPGEGPDAERKEAETTSPKSILKKESKYGDWGAPTRTPCSSPRTRNGSASPRRDSSRAGGRVARADSKGPRQSASAGRDRRGAGDRGPAVQRPDHDPSRSHTVPAVPRLSHVPARQLLRRGPSEGYRQVEEEDGPPGPARAARPQGSAPHLRRAGPGPNGSEHRIREPQQQSADGTRDVEK